MGVSILVASYNCEQYIDECLDSLFEQSYDGTIEIIVCDDCSVDGTVHKLQQYADQGKIIFLKNKENLGAAASRNACLHYATQEYVAILDADDYSHPDRLRIQATFLDENPKVDFVSTGLQKFFDNGLKKEIYPKIDNPVKRDFLYGLPFMHATTMFRKEVLDNVCGYRVGKETKRGQDYDLFMRIYANGGVGVNIHSILYYYRCFTGSTHKNKFRYRFDEAIIRYKGFKAMKLGIISWPYIVKPLLLGLFPQRLVDKIAKH